MGGVLRDLRERGIEPPAVAVGDCALGFWAALRDVFPQTREQRCWVHKTANVLDALPKRLHEQAKAAPHVWGTKTRGWRIGIRTVLTPIATPQANAIAERLVGTFRRECLDHIIVMNERHLRYVLREFVRHYNTARPHQALELDVPEPGTGPPGPPVGCRSTRFCTRRSRRPCRPAL